MAREQTADEIGWIGGKRFDLVFFFGSALIAMGVGALALMVPAAVVPLFWGFLLFVEGPHLVATWSRTYLDASERRRRGRLLVGSLAWLLPGIFAWLAAHAAHSRAPIDLFLLFATLWSYHHAIRQFYGILAIYHHHDQSSLTARKYDRYLLHGSLWIAFGLFSFGHPQNRNLFGFPQQFPFWLSAAAIGLLVLLGVTVVAYAIFRRSRFPQESMRPLLFLLGPAIGLECYAMFVVGAFEPLIPRPEDPEQAFLATQVVGGIVHGMNYLGITSIVGLRRYGQNADRSVAAFLGRRPGIAYLAFVMVSLGYLALNAVRGILPGIRPFARESLIADLCLVVYWGIFFHHYYLDQHIWHVRSDESLRFELGLAKPVLSSEARG
ncbi:MAG TPA: hypothetical protein PK156_06845 [Polyangium sp.]|nr:hypothetical protein [Polyangium sp.]